MSVSTNIKRLRKSNKLTQDDLAEKMHVTRQAISNWETGKNQPDIETLGLLATIFGTDVSELIYGNKKGCYPKYQRKYVIYVGVCLLAIIAFVIIRCFLQAKIGKSCKTFLEKIASPFWRKLQRPDQPLFRLIRRAIVA